MRCGFHYNRGYVESPPPVPSSNARFASSPWADPAPLPSLQRQHQTSIRRHGPRINSPRGTVALDRMLGHKAENGMMSRVIRGYL